MMRSTCRSESDSDRKAVHPLAGPVVPEDSAVAAAVALAARLRNRGAIPPGSAHMAALILDTHEAYTNAYACGAQPVMLEEVQDADEKFWSCPCAIARAMRDAKQHEEALWDTANSHSVHLARVHRPS